MKDYEDEELEDLYFDIGSALVSIDNLLEEDRSINIKIGKEWFLRNLSKIQNLICKDIKKYIDSDYATMITLLADVLTGIAGIVPVGTIAKTIAKIGINKICQMNASQKK